VTTPTRCAPLRVTGASGWIGGALLREAARREWDVQGVPRWDPDGPTDTASWQGAVIVHLAAIAHRGRGEVGEADYLRVNRDLPIALARAARAAGARRFVFVSSAAVMGAVSTRPWTETDPPAPQDPYAKAKWAAEQALWPLHEPGRFEVVVVRPPLVWGPGARANFRALVEAATGRLPLPLGRADAPRSMVFLDNLVDALLHVASSPQAAGGTFFVRDPVDRSVAQWITALRARLGRGPGLLGVPPAWVRVAARLVGREGAYQRLFGASQLDDTALRATGWHAPVPFDAALDLTLRALRPTPATPQ